MFLPYKHFTGRGKYLRRHSCGSVGIAVRELTIAKALTMPIPGDPHLQLEQRKDNIMSSTTPLVAL